MAESGVPPPPNPPPKPGMSLSFLCSPLEVEAKWVGRPGMLGAELAGCDPAARLHATRAALHLDTVDRTTHNALYNAFDGRTLRVVDEFKVASAEWDGTEWAVTRVPDDATVVAAFDHSSHRPWGAAAACFEAEPDIIACDVIWVVPEEEPHAPGDGVLVGAAEQAACGLAGGLAVLDPSPAPVWPGGKIPMYLVGRAASLATGPGVWLPAGLRVCAAAVADAVVARLSVARSVGSCPPRPAAASEGDDSSSLFAGVGSLLKLKQTAQHCGAGSPAQASASAYASSHPPHAGTEFRSAPACGGWGGSQVRAVGCSPYDLSPASPDRGPACAPIIYDYEPADPVVGMGLVQEVTTARANADFEARPSAMATDMPASPAYAEATPQVMHVSVAPHPSQAAAAALAWSPLALPQAPGPRCLDVCRDATTPSPVAAAASPMLHAPTPNGFFPQPGADAPPPPPPRADTARRPAGIVNISDLRPSFPVHQIIQFSWVDDGFFIRILLTLPEGVDKEQARKGARGREVEGVNGGNRLKAVTAFSPPSILPPRCGWRWLQCRPTSWPSGPAPHTACGWGACIRVSCPTAPPWARRLASARSRSPCTRSGTRPGGFCTLRRREEGGKMGEGWSGGRLAQPVPRSACVGGACAARAAAQAGCARAAAQHALRQRLVQASR